VREVAATFVQVWEVVAEVLAELDVLASFADVATSAAAPFVRPEMLAMEDGEITLTQSRHPCLELQEGVDIIANDCALKRGESWFQLITGPNMGGKSTYIRQVCAQV
jgi:DNA mismatch repair protein MSH2